VAFPINDLPADVLHDILRGGADKAREAEIPVVGGHSIEDREPKYGMVVTGIVGPEGALTNASARPGDRIVLTKPLGSGILATAIKRGLLEPSAIEQVVAVMTHLNAGAARAAREAGVSAATDVTGFGLLGHLKEMAAASGLAARIEASRVPVLPGVAGFAADGVVPRGTRRNEGAVASLVTFAGHLDQATRTVLADAQTSGGLLLAVSEERHAVLIDALRRNGTLEQATIGEFVTGTPGTLDVRG
jgi:selenide,water dikinase